MISKKEAIAYIPIVTFFVGLFLFLFGIYGKIENENFKEAVTGLGKMLFTGGVFALLLKQFNLWVCLKKN